MNNEVFCYHTRDAFTGTKLVGGTLHAKDFNDAAEKACLSYQAVENRSYWADKLGRKFFIYLSVCSDQTQHGRPQQAAFRKARCEREAQARRVAEEAQERLDALVEKIGVERATAVLAASQGK